MTTSNNHIIKELLVTISALAMYRLMLMIPLPFIDFKEFNSIFDPVGTLFFGNNHFSHISITALGLMPFCSAYLMVEILSLFLPFLKKHRGGDYNGRKTLKKYALGLTLILSVIQSYYLIQGLEGILSSSGSPILILSDNLQFIALLATLSATVFFLIFLAEVVSRYGIGNGISLLILSGTCSGIFVNMLNFFNDTSEIDLNFFHVILFSVIAIYLFIFIPILLVKTTFTIPLKHKSDDSYSNYLKLSCCLSGKEVIYYATSLLMLPATLFSFMGGLEFLATSLAPGTVGYYFFSCIFVIVLSYTFGWLFLSPKKRLETLDDWGWKSKEVQPVTITFIKQKFLYMNIPWTLFLCAVLVVPTIAISGFNIPFYLGGASLIVMALISLDVISRLRLRNENVYEKLYNIAEFHDVHHATMIKNHLNSENITFYLQGFYHRHLLYFFGPFIPINLMVPAREINKVKVIISRYYGGLGLVR